MLVSSLYEMHDPGFAKLVQQNEKLERIWTGGRWCEGPAWFPAGKYAIWSDIPNDRVMRWDATDGSVSEFIRPAFNQNGHTVDLEGRLVSCEHKGRCVSRIEHDGSRTVLADRFDDKRLNSPNDVVVKSDGSIWFTDPTYGIDSDYEGDAAPSEIKASNVYRISPDGKVSCVVSDLVQPNGLAFSFDEKLLYVADTGFTHDPACTPKICAYRVSDDGTRVGAGRLITTSDSGLFDGFRLDTEGRIWTSAGDGVQCYDSNGTLLGTILVPEVVANLCFTGPKLNRLLICATTSVYSIYVNAKGLR
ncbi:SMP-30/gluconolactonase/LRE family protein [Roseibium sp.]|uniref:SMP-30/gluconolactonase/LRE family protein n=1 Tax=Roseibium sp. TaxID=1936156 RepID=UPI003A96DD72